MNNVRVKICGLTNLEDARVAAEAGADLLGFIFYPKSPRYVAPETVADTIQALQDSISHAARPRFVGVFVNESVERITEILALTGLDYAQLHGNESVETVAHFQGRAFKALRPASADEAIAAAATFAPLGPALGPNVFVDAYDPNLYGGTGKTADWCVAAELATHYPGLLLAGGLTPENVAEAIQIARPWGVDVSSGVEAMPGRKDHGKVKAFIQQAKNSGFEGTHKTVP